MEYDEFKAHEGQSVVIRSAERQLEGQIASVDSLGGSEGRDRVPFSVLITTPLDPVLEQGTYQLAVGGGPGMDLFMVPIGPDGELMRYEIIFN